MVSDGILLPGQDVCRVPMDCFVISPARAVQMSDGLQALDEHIVAELPDWTILALYLVDVMQQRTKSSLYSAYAHVLHRRLVYVKADRLYMPGDQVMISYGNQKTRGEFLLQYGFLPPASENTYDACLFPIDIVLEDGDDDVVTDGMGRMVFPLSLQGLPEGILKYAAVASIQEQQSGGYVTKQDNNILDGSDGDLSKETRKRALKWLIGRMKQRQHDMATSMEDAKRLVGKDGLDTRRQRIGAVLLHEHRVLSKAQFMVQQFYRQL
eukprot:jgi/Picre1/28704/NNA_004104.t1